MIGLVILAFALGSLPRGSPGGTLLFESTWLLYLVYLGPVVILGLMIAFVIFIALNWRDIGAALGFGIAQKRMMKKRRSRYSFFLSLVLWAIAIGVLFNKPGSIFNPIKTNSTTLVEDVTNQGGNPPNPFLGGSFLPAVSSIVQNDWFSLAFLGLLVVGGLVLVQSIRVSLKETSELKIEDLRARQLEGLQAARDALKLIDDKNAGDARSRIITCYQHMVEVVLKLGVQVSSDQTARELEEAIRSTFFLKGSATGDLTRLFEEARYSLHEIIDEDTVHARDYLESIAEELNIQLDN